MRISDASLFDVPVVRATRLSPKQGDRLRTTRPTPKARNEKLKKQELLLGWERIGLTLTLGVWEVLWKYKNTRRITQSFNLIFQATTSMIPCLVVGPTVAQAMSRRGSYGFGLGPKRSPDTFRPKAQSHNP